MIVNILGIKRFILGMVRKIVTTPEVIETELEPFEDGLDKPIEPTEPIIDPIEDHVIEEEIAEESDLEVEEDIEPVIDDPVVESDTIVEDIPKQVKEVKCLDYCIFMQPVINITTRANSLTHKGYQAWDIAGLDKNIQNVYAPFRCKVLTKYPYPANSGKVNSGNTFIIGSCDEEGNPAEVIWENGEKHVMSFAITHDDDINDISVGQIFESGDILCQEGKAGFATGNHVHIEPAIGWQYYKHIKNTGNGKYYVIDNNCAIADIFVVLKGFHQKIKNANGYTFREVTARCCEVEE